MKTTPRQKQTRSRNGCITCKARRVKCDETRPSCQQCSLQGTTCGGYPNFLKWRAVEKINNERIAGDGTRKMNERRSAKSSYRSLREKSDAPVNSPITQASLDDSWPPLANIIYPPITALLETAAADSTAVETGHIAGDSPLGLSEQEQSIVHRMYSSSTGTSTEPPNLDCFSFAVAVNPANHELTGLHDLGLETTGDASASDDDLCRAIQSHEEIIRRDERFQGVDIEEPHWQHDIRSGGGFYSDIFGPDSSDYNEMNTLTQQLQFPGGSQIMIRRFFVGYTSSILSIRDGDSVDLWQALVWPMARDCPALHHALAAMTCAHLSKSQEQLNLLSMKHFNLSVQALLISMDNNGSMPLEAEIATRFALAFAESWNCHTPATGVTHLNDARALIQQAVQKRFASEPVNSNWNV